MATDPENAQLPSKEPAFHWPFPACACLLLALGLLTIVGCVTAPFSFYDDFVYINPTHLALPDYGWFQPFTESYNSIYMPLAQLSFKLNLALCGEEATWSFRLFNAILHAGSGLLVLGLLKRLGLRPGEALFVAAAWTAHPLACECVSWASQRHTVMSMFFGMAGLCAYVKWHTQWRGILWGALGFLLALLSKPSALGFFPVFLAIELLGGPDRIAKTPAEWKETRSTLPNSAGLAVRLAPFILLTGIFALVGIVGARIRLIPPPGGSWYTALMTDTEIFVRYLYNVLVPLKLSAFYGVKDIDSFQDPRLYYHGAILAAAVALSTGVARSPRRAILGWLWFFGALGPNANLVGITFTMQDRYVYISAVGLLLVAAESVLGLSTLPRRRLSTPTSTPPPQGLVTAAGALYVLLLCGLTVQRSFTWNDTLALFTEATQRQPQCGLARIQHGLMQAKEADKRRKDGGPGSHEAAFMHSTWALQDLQYAIQDCPDTYRYFDPLRLHVALAREAFHLKQFDTARAALNPFLPPRPASQASFRPGENERRLGFRAMQWGAYPYFYRQQTLADAYMLASDIELSEAQSPAVAPQKKKESIALALSCAQKAIEADPKRSCAFWNQAQCHNLLKILALAEHDQETAQKQGSAARSALEQIGFSSPYYGRAQAELRGAPPAAGPEPDSPPDPLPNVSSPHGPRALE